MLATAHTQVELAAHLSTKELTLAVPIGVVFAAVISFLALRWSTNATLRSQQQTLDKNLAAQRRTTDLSLSAQRETNEMNLAAQREISRSSNFAQRTVAADDRLFEKRVEHYVPLIQSLIEVDESNDLPYTLADRQRSWHQDTFDFIKNQCDLSSKVEPLLLAFASESVLDRYSLYAGALRKAWLAMYDIVDEFPVNKASADDSNEIVARNFEHETELISIIKATGKQLLIALRSDLVAIADRDDD